MGNYVKDVGRRFDRIRRSRPELGKLRLALIILMNWPTFLMTLLGSGNVIVRMGFTFPTILIVFSIVLSYFTGSSVTVDNVIMSLSFAMMVVGVWAVFGVISTVFNTPVSEGILYRIEKLVKGLPESKKATLSLFAGNMPK
jgi:hypothetical protein